MLKSTIITIALLTLVATLLLIQAVSADIVVGVKKGDWLQYKVVETGNTTPDYNITWARIDVTSVQGEKITVDVKTGYANGTLFPEPHIPLNLATGAVGDGFFIPANLNIGDSFYSEYQGNITITGMWRLEVGGAVRNVISATSNQTTYYWDRQTGILVGATTSFPSFTLFTRTSGTNIWQPQILGLDSNMFYSIAITVTIIILVMVVFLAWRGRRRRFS